MGTFGLLAIIKIVPLSEKVSSINVGSVAEHPIDSDDTSSAPTLDDGKVAPSEAPIIVDVDELFDPAIKIVPEETAIIDGVDGVKDLMDTDFSSIADGAQATVLYIINIGAFVLFQRARVEAEINRCFAALSGPYF